MVLTGKQRTFIGITVTILHGIIVVFITTSTSYYYLTYPALQYPVTMEHCDSIPSTSNPSSESHFTPGSHRSTAHSTTHSTTNSSLTSDNTTTTTMNISNFGSTFYGSRSQTENPTSEYPQNSQSSSTSSSTSTCSNLDIEDDQLHTWALCPISYQKALMITSFIAIYSLVFLFYAQYHIVMLLVMTS